MIVTIGACALALVGALAMAISGGEHVRGESYKSEAVVGLCLIALAMAMVAS